MRQVGVIELKPEVVRQYFASKLPDIRWKGNQGTARCPCHSDHRASLSVNAEKRVFFCHGCRVSGNLIAFERKTSKCDLKTAKERIAKLANRAGGSQIRPTIVRLYSYRDETGKLVYQQVRFHPKDFRFRRPADDGGWTWNLQGVNKILYRLREVIASDEVFIVEGEKDVETLRALGLRATTAPGGAGKWTENYSRVFKDKRVIVLQDNDEPGWKHAQAVAHSVADYARQVILVPPFQDAKDISEWMERRGTKAKLKKLVANAKPFERSENTSAAVGVKDGRTTLFPDDWRSKPLRGAWTVRLPEGLFQDYLILPTGIPFVASLWTIGTYLFKEFDCYPYLSITSPTKRCGKTRFAEISELLCARPLMSVNISEAALFRSIAMDQPTVIIDEAEALRNKDSERAQYLLSILQAGYREGLACRT